MRPLVLPPGAAALNCVDGYERGSSASKLKACLANLATISLDPETAHERAARMSVANHPRLIDMCDARPHAVRGITRYRSALRASPRCRRSQATLDAYVIALAAPPQWMATSWRGGHEGAIRRAPGRVNGRGRLPEPSARWGARWGALRGAAWAWVAPPVVPCRRIRGSGLRAARVPSMRMVWCCNPSDNPFKIRRQPQTTAHTQGQLWVSTGGSEIVSAEAP